jgi:hypothetical protein
MTLPIPGIEARREPSSNYVLSSQRSTVIAPRKSSPRFHPRTKAFSPAISLGRGEGHLTGGYLERGIGDFLEVLDAGGDRHLQGKGTGSLPWTLSQCLLQPRDEVVILRIRDAGGQRKGRHLGECGGESRGKTSIE